MLQAHFFPWDNRCLLHAGSGYDADRHRRYMRQTRISGTCSTLEEVGYSQIVLMKEEVQELCRRFDESGRESFEKEMLPTCPFSGND